MIVVVEFDGILFDVKPAYRYAYARAVEKIGFARTDDTTFWRLLRIGAGDGELVRGAKPRHLEAFRACFEEQLESPAAIALMTPHLDAKQTAGILRELAPRALVTVGINPTTRLELLKNHHLADQFPQLSTISRSTALGASQLRDLAKNDRVVVLGAQEQILRAADEAGIPSIGITSGPCVGKRLERHGARATFADLEAFHQARLERNNALEELGLALAPPAAPRSPSRPSKKIDDTQPIPRWKRLRDDR